MRITSITFGRVALLFTILSMLTGVNRLNAQEYPNFTTATVTPGTNIQSGLALTQFGSDVNPNAIFMAYVSSLQRYELGTAFSNDGINYTDQGIQVDQQQGTRFYVDCYHGPALCSVAVAKINNNLAYIAYADQNASDSLAIIEVTKVPGNANWSFLEIANGTDYSIHLTSAPAMAVYNGNLIIRYGTSVQNQAYTTELSSQGVWSIHPSNGYAPTQSALVVFNNQLYAIDKQNNSSNGVFVSKLDGNGVYIPHTSYQVPGFYTRRGLSAAVYNNNIVVSIQQDASSNYLYLFSSPDGANWYSKEYTGIRVGDTPFITPFSTQTGGAGLSLAFKSNDSYHLLFGAFAQ